MATATYTGYSEVIAANIKDQEIVKGLFEGETVAAMWKRFNDERGIVKDATDSFEGEKDLEKSISNAFSARVQKIKDAFAKQGVNLATRVRTEAPDIKSLLQFANSAGYTDQEYVEQKEDK